MGTIRDPCTTFGCVVRAAVRGALPLERLAGVVRRVAVST